MKRISALVFTTLAFVLLLTGCTPELHERLLVSAIGVDLSEQGYRVTVRAAPTVEGEAEICLTGDGQTVSEALNHITLQTGRKPLYAYNTLIVFGKPCAENGLDNCLDFFIRNYDTRPTVQIFLSESTAEEILTPTSDDAAWTSRQLAQLAESENYSGLTVNVNLVDLVNDAYGTKGAALLPILKAGAPPSILGIAFLQGLTFQHTLDENAVQGYLALCGELESGAVTIFDADYGKMALTANSSQCNIHFTGTKDNPRFEIEIQIEGEIGSVTKSVGQLDNNVFPRLEQAYASAILEQVQSYLSSIVYADGSDVSALCRTILWEAPDVWHDIADHAEEFLQNAVFDIHVQAKITRVEKEDRPYF